MSPLRVRWRLLIWPLLVLVLAAGIGYLVVWTDVDSPSRQHQVIRTVLLSAAAGLFAATWAIVWLLFLSRLGIRTRLVALGLSILALGVLAGLASLSFEVRGVTGDTVPILAWRWTPEPGEMASAVPVSVATVSPEVESSSARFDYPQFLGPERNGRVNVLQLETDWSEAGPREKWRRRIGAGWSGFAVAGSLAVTQEQRGEQELVTCYDLQTGELVWSHADLTRFEEPISGLGPRATPTIDGGRVFTIGGTGKLNALDLSTGRVLWSVDVFHSNSDRLPDYGVSASPLAYDGKVVVGGPGGSDGSLLAYDRETGARLWSGGSDPPAYSSPVLAELAGRRQIVMLNGAALTSHDAGDGSVIWRREWPGGTENVSQPLILAGDRVFASTGYGVGGKLFRVARDGQGGVGASLEWESRALKAKFTNVVHREGYLFGLDDGILASVSLEDGRRMWKGGRYGHGQVVLVGDVLLIMGEKGVVALVDADPRAYVEHGAFRALSGKTWNHPALSGRYLLVRNDREAACYEMPLKQRSREEREGT